MSRCFQSDENMVVIDKPIEICTLNIKSSNEYTLTHDEESKYEQFPFFGQQQPVSFRYICGDVGDNNIRF